MYYAFRLASVLEATVRVRVSPGAPGLPLGPGCAPSKPERDHFGVLLFYMRLLSFMPLGQFHFHNRRQFNYQTSRPL